MAAGAQNNPGLLSAPNKDARLNERVKVFVGRLGFLLRPDGFAAARLRLRPRMTACFFRTIARTYPRTLIRAHSAGHPLQQGLRLELGDLRKREAHRTGGRTQPRPSDVAVLVARRTTCEDERKGAPVKTDARRACRIDRPQGDHPRHACVERQGRIQPTQKCEALPLRTPVQRPA